jgi:hypothetical protein
VSIRGCRHSRANSNALRYVLLSGTVYGG